MYFYNNSKMQRPRCKHFPSLFTVKENSKTIKEHFVYNSYWITLTKSKQLQSTDSRIIKKVQEPTWIAHVTKHSLSHISDFKRLNNTISDYLRHFSFTGKKQKKFLMQENTVSYRLIIK